MEKQEKNSLDAIRRHLTEDLRKVDLLLRHAAAPRLDSDGGSSGRARAVVGSIRKRGGRVSRRDLGVIAASAGIPSTAVGTLYQAGYVRTDPKDERYVRLGPKAAAAGGPRR